MKMKELEVANARLKTARDEHEARYKDAIERLNSEEQHLLARIEELEKKKADTAKEHGCSQAADEDVLRINAGGQPIDVKRGTLARVQGTRLEAIFSGRWDKKLQRDGQGRIFLDVNPTAFQAVVDYLHEMSISSEDDPPRMPRVNDEHQHLLDHQLELLGLRSARLPDSNILNQNSHFNLIHDWLGESRSDGDFKLLYRSSRDGSGSQAFHTKCDRRGATLTLIETEQGFVVGGFSDVSWSSSSSYCCSNSNKAFVFVITGDESVTVPCRLKLKSGVAIGRKSSWGPTFGYNSQKVSDVQVRGTEVDMNFGTSYEVTPFGPIANMTHSIKEMEVFNIVQKPQEEKPQEEKPQEEKPQEEREEAKQEDHLLRNKLLQIGRVDDFTDSINTTINTKWASLQSVESKVLHLEDSFKMEEQLVCSFADGEPKDIIALNVSGTRMTTMRQTLQAISDSVLARQFDDTKWTEHGVQPRVEEWKPHDVVGWANGLANVPAGVGELLAKHSITGPELLTLNMEGLKMLGVERVGTACLLLNKINQLSQASKDVVTLIEHSPYCMGKIIDYLRLKSLHSQGLANPPTLPQVCSTQKTRYDKVVKYYFPGENAKLLCGE